jgi:hypothetical protein
MLSSITPLGERSRHQRYWLTVTWYWLGSVVGGLVLGGLTGLIGQSIRVLVAGDSIRLPAMISVCVLVLVLDVFYGARRPPTRLRQVNEDWLTRYRGWVYGVGFGFQLGLGIITVVTSWYVYGLIVALLLLGDVTHALLVGVVFGVARAIPMVFTIGLNDTSSMRQFHRRFADSQTPARIGCLGVLFMAIVAAAIVTY